MFSDILGMLEVSFLSFLLTPSECIVTILITFIFLRVLSSYCYFSLFPSLASCVVLFEGVYDRHEQVEG